MNVKEKADALVEKYSPLASMWDCYWDTPNHENNDIKSAILSVEHTIDVLQSLYDKISDLDWADNHTMGTINEQTELLTELKSRL